MSKFLRKFLCIAIILFTSVNVFAQKNEKTKTDISYTDAVILGFVEGITEYLPVSSTGHLLITNALLGLDSKEPIVDKNGLNVIKSDGEVYTTKLLADSYAIVIQFGAIASVAILYWRTLLSIVFGLLGRNPQGLKLFVNLCVAFLPAAIVGLLFHKIIESVFFGIMPIIIALVVGALVMIVIQKKYDKNNSNRKIQIQNLSISQSFVIGVLQCVSLIPGTSRSMVTILGGYLVGMNAKNSAMFSFLLGLITLSSASAYKLYTDGEAMLNVLSPKPMLVGIIVAFVSSLIAVKWLVGFLTKNGLVPFAIYRLLIAVILTSMLYLNFI